MIKRGKEANKIIKENKNTKKGGKGKKRRKKLKRVRSLRYKERQRGGRKQGKTKGHERGEREGKTGNKKTQDPRSEAHKKRRGDKGEGVEGGLVGRRN